MKGLWVGAKAAAAVAWGVLGRGGRALTLVPAFLSGLLWLIAQTFVDLARQGYGGNAAVYACLRLLSQSVPEPPLLAYTLTAAGDLNQALAWDHPLRAHIRQPNELMSEYEYWELVTLHLGITGRSFWFKERDRAGRLLAQWPLRPDRVGPIYSTDTAAGDKLVAGWSYLIPGTSDYLPLRRDDVVFYHYPDPAGESGGVVEGLGPMQVLAAEIAADNEATRFVGSLLNNAAVPGVVLTTKAPIRDKETAERIKASFMAQFGGARRGVPAVLDAETTLAPMGFNLQQLEFPNLRDVSESRIAAAFGVPAILVGLRTGLQSGIRATISEQREYFAETTLANMWRRLANTYSNEVASEYGEGVVCEFDLTKVKALQAQGRYELDRLAQGFAAGAVTVDEYRTGVLNLPALGGEVGQAVYVPTTSGPVPSGELLDDTVPVQVDDYVEDPSAEDLAGDDDAQAPPAPAKSARPRAVRRRATKAPAEQPRHADGWWAGAGERVAIPPDPDALAEAYGRALQDMDAAETAAAAGRAALVAAMDAHGPASPEVAAADRKLRPLQQRCHEAQRRASVLGAAHHAARAAA